MNKAEVGPKPAAWALTLARAEAMAAEIETLHPSARAVAIYCYGSGGYVVVAQSPLAHQETVAILSEDAYTTFRKLRSDAWERLASGTAQWVTKRERREIADIRAAKQRQEEQGQ